MASGKEPRGKCLPRTLQTSARDDDDDDDGDGDGVKCLTWFSR